jgi:orotidine-5'-phosphate decarboxylase
MPGPNKAIAADIRPKDRIVIALDVDSPDKARNIVAELTGLVGAFKVGLQLFTAAGPSFVRELSLAGHRVFLDLKFHDIPTTVARAGVEAARLGVWMLNVHALGGAEMMRRTAADVDAACVRESLVRPKIIAVTVLTSSTDDTLRETGIERDTLSQAASLALLAGECGLDGVVASPLEAKRIRENARSAGFTIVTPGIRLKDASIDDQRRVTTPGAAVAAGSDYIVLGRPVLGSPDMPAVVEKIAAEIAELR